MPAYEHCSLLKERGSMDDTLKILAVDDVEMNLEMLELMLSSLGGVFLKAGNGREALQVLEHNRDTDIILLDLEMPVMDGFETLAKLKKNNVLREIPVIVITSGRNEVLRTLALGANDFLAKPYDKEELKLRVMNHVRSKKLFDFSRDMNKLLEIEVARKTLDLQKALARSQEAEYEISLRLGRAAEFRDLETGMHTQRVSELSMLLSSLAGLAEEECELVRKAAPLHDVGKIGIPDNILLKPGKLEYSEFEIMKLHTMIGGKILTDAAHYPILDAGSIIALQHHEKWDGSGYPNGLKGEGIHIYGRIVMIVDVFDALTSDRPYKKAFPLDKAVEIMVEGRGGFFDPTLLDLFLEHLDRFVQIREILGDAPGEQSHLSDLVKFI
jgi:putative two-component system response regulator